jgi:hypothetical protein
MQLVPGTWLRWVSTATPTAGPTFSLTSVKQPIVFALRAEATGLALVAVRGWWVSAAKAILGSQNYHVLT